MDVLVNNGIILVLSEFFWYLIDEFSYGKLDIKMITIISSLTLITISLIPLLITITDVSLFNSKFYQNYLDFTTNYLIGAIIGTIFYPIFKKIF